MSARTRIQRLSGREINPYRGGVERHPRVGGAHGVRDTSSGRSGEAVSLERRDGRRFAPDKPRSINSAPMVGAKRRPS